jgi:hypothetical protein
MALAPFVLLACPRLWPRPRPSRAKHALRRGHSKWSRRSARQIPCFEQDEQRFVVSNAAPSVKRDGGFKVAEEGDGGVFGKLCRVMSIDKESIAPEVADEQ